MVAEQVFRVDGRSVAGLVALALLAIPGAAEANDEPVAIIDLRSDASVRPKLRETVGNALVHAPDLAPIDDREIAAALGGDSYDTGEGTAKQALVNAREAYGSLDCVKAAASAETAVTALAAVQARGVDVRESLVQAYVYVLLCSGDDEARAFAAAVRLRALGADPPAGVSATVWAKYPDVDATSNVYMVSLDVTTEPDGAEVWIDHERVGKAPLTVHVSEGDHVVAAAAEGAGAAVRLAIRGRQNRDVKVEIPAGADPSGRADAIRAWVDNWRTGERAPTPRDIYQLLETVGVRTAVLLTVETETGSDRVEAWGNPTGGTKKVASLIGSGRPDQLGEVFQLIRTSLTSWDRTAPLATPAPVRQPDKGTYRTKPWWVYAAIAGAVVLGGAVIISSELAEDRQVIRLEYP